MNIQNHSMVRNIENILSLLTRVIPNLWIAIHERIHFFFFKKSAVTLSFNNLVFLTLYR